MTAARKNHLIVLIIIIILAVTAIITIISSYPGKYNKPSKLCRNDKCAGRMGSLTNPSGCALVRNVIMKRKPGGGQ